MKRLEEILKTHCPSMDRLFLDNKGVAFRERIFDAMREYAREVAQASLEKAVENAKIVDKYPNEFRYGLTISKESITNESNITLL